MIRHSPRGVAAALSVALSLRAAVAQVPALAAKVAPAPHIRFDATEVNLGDVIHGQDAVGTFTYHNAGSSPLHILAAKPG